MMTQPSSPHSLYASKQIPPPVSLSSAQLRREWLKCGADAAYFIVRYGWLYNATQQAWLQFELWPAQAQVMTRLQEERLLVVLKARQLGLSWLTLAYALWLVIFHAPATVLLFSLREAEAVELLARLRGMYTRLPAWLQARRVEEDAANRWRLSNGSRVLAFSTRGGRSYTGTLAIVDEADYVPDLGNFLNGVKPTIDGGGQLFLVSTSDKRQPISPYKNLFRAGMAETGAYRAIFLPWQAHPQRNAAWATATQAEMYAQRGTHDDFYAEYPATPEEALAPAQLDRRLPLDWLQACIAELPVLTPVDAPALAGLTVYEQPQAGRRYVIGADPAEGNPRSDESAACVLDAESWAEVATLAGKLEPGRFAQELGQVASYYNSADLLVERNNHGHTVIRLLQEAGMMRLLAGYDGKPGWLSNIKGKPLLYDALAQAVREGSCRIRGGETVAQLAALEASSLRAPSGLHDDRADAFALALGALILCRGGEGLSSVAPAVDPLAVMDESREW